MRNLFLASTALVGVTSAVIAADLPSRSAAHAPVPVFTQFNWSGFYLGASAGAIYSNHLIRDNDYWNFGGTAAYSSIGVLGGATVGYNVQFNRLVLGLEGDLSFVSTDANAYSVGDRRRIENEMNYLGTVRGRVGLAVDRTFIYVTAGVAFADVKNSYTDSVGRPGEAAETWRKGGNRFGLVGGAGVEYAVTNNWTVKGEALYANLAEKTDSLTIRGSERRFGFASNHFLARLGVNYKFGGSSVGPDLATMVAADLPSRSAASASAPVFVQYDWSGFYVGLSTGAMSSNYSLNDLDYRHFGGTANHLNTGFLGGATVGYNAQFGRLVLGVEGDLSFVSNEANAFSVRDRTRTTNDINTFGTVRARMGVADDRTLVYVTAGVAVADVENSFATAARTWRKSGSRVGLVAGAGVEYAVTNNWTVKAEGLYAALDEKTDTNFADGPAGARFGFASHHFLARLGVNYKFGGSHSPGRSAGQAPVPVFNQYSWSGFYLGLSAGAINSNHAVNDLDFEHFGGSAEYSSTGVLGGATLGYNAQFGRLVLGVEGDLSFVANDANAFSARDRRRVRNEMDYMGTVRGRMGLAVDRALVYVTAGVAFADVENYFTRRAGDPDEAARAWRNSGARFGLVGGAGVEYALNHNWTVKGEALYVGLAEKTVELAPRGFPFRFGFASHHVLARVGVNYKFGGASAGPVIAAY